MDASTAPDLTAPIVEVRPAGNNWLIFRKGQDRPTSVNAHQYEEWDYGQRPAKDTGALYQDLQDLADWFDQEQIGATLRDNYAAQYGKPLTDDERRRMIADIDQRPDAAELRALVWPRGLPWWTSAPDLDNLPPPPAPLLTRSDGQMVIPSDRSVSIYAPPERGKTWIGLLVCLSAIRQGGRAVFLDYEMNVRDTYKRLRLLGGYKPANNPDQFRYVYGPDMAAETIEAAAQWAAQRPGSVAVVDSVNRAGGYSTHPTEYLEWANSNVAPYRRKGVGMILMDHAAKTKPIQGSNYEGPMGTGQKVADVDIVLKVDGQPWTTTEDGTITLTRVKDRHGDIPGPERVAAVTGSHRDGAFGLRVHEPAPAPVQARGKSSRARRLKRLEGTVVWLRKHGEPATAFEIGRGIGVSKNTARGYCNELVASGEMTVEREGKTDHYSLPDTQGILTLPTRE